MSLVDDLLEIKSTAEEKLTSVSGLDELETWRIEYLGSHGKVKAALKKIREIPARQKAEYGQAANDIKNHLQNNFEKKKEELEFCADSSGKGPIEDITLPGIPPCLGHSHIITQTIHEICDIFGKMGFESVYGPEVEDEHHNFTGLNIPPEHPARDPLDNFFIEKDCDSEMELTDTMLRSQTSTVQIRVMENRRPPLRIVAPGRVYRPDTVDATHSFMFHQLEGLYVDKDVTMVDLRTCVDQFCKAYFGPEVKTRFRPHFFPFTEPSAEVDLLFQSDDGSSKWVEMAGCGMVDPAVLEAVDIDPEIYTGWAFGMGIERMVMRKYDIPDIRMLYESDIRFLHQF